MTGSSLIVTILLIQLVAIPGGLWVCPVVGAFRQYIRVDGSCNDLDWDLRSRLFSAEPEPGFSF